MMSISMTADNDSGLGKLIRTKMTATPSSDQWRAASDELRSIDRQMEKRVPDDRHKQRMSALYVDPISVDGIDRQQQYLGLMRATFLRRLLTTMRRNISSVTLIQK
jgi:hypothetical protein